MQGVKSSLFKTKWIFLSFIFWTIIFLKIPSEFLDLGGDSSQYIILAESLAKGLGYRAINYPNSPFFYHYPPLFPLVLAGVIYFFGENFYLMYVLMAILGYLTLIFSYHLFRRYIDHKLAFFIVLLLSTNWIFLFYSSQCILSDIFYSLLSILTLIFISEYINKKEVINKEGIFSVLGLILCYFARYIGLTLFLATLFGLLFQNNLSRKFRKIVFVSLCFFCPFLVWQATIRILNPHALSTYSKQFLLIDPYKPYLGTLLEHPRFIFIRLIEGVNYYYRMIGKILFLWFARKGVFFEELFSFVSLVLILLGLWKITLAKKTYLFFWYFFIYFSLIVFWPYREGVRFLLPILPFLYFYFVAGIGEVFKKFPKVIYLVLIFLFFLNLTFSFSQKKISYKYLPNSLKHFLSAHYWINKHLPKIGIIVSRKPTLTYILTSHKSIIYPFSLDPDKIWQELEREEARYIIIDEFSRESYYYLLPFIYKYRDKLKLLYKQGNTGIFEVKKGR